MRVHTITAKVCAGTKVAASTEHKYPVTTSTTRYDTSPLGEVTIAARPGAGSRFTVDFGRDGQIAVRQREYCILQEGHMLEAPRELRKALARAGGQHLLRIVLTCVSGGVILPAMVVFKDNGAMRLPPLPVFALGILLSLIWALPHVLQSMKRPAKFLRLDRLSEKDQPSKWWTYGVWLVRSDLFDKSAFADSLDRICVIETVSIVKQEDYWFPYTEQYFDFVSTTK